MLEEFIVTWELFGVGVLKGFGFLEDILIFFILLLYKYIYFSLFIREI